MLWGVGSEVEFREDVEFSEVLDALQQSSRWGMKVKDRNNANLF